MTPIFQRLRIFSRQNKIHERFYLSHAKARDFASINDQKPETLLKNNFFRFLWSKTSLFVRPFSGPTETGHRDDDDVAVWIQNILKFRRHKTTEEIEEALDRTGVSLTEELLLNVLRRHRSDWRPAFVFFNWASKVNAGDGFSPGTESHNEIVDILGKMRRFEEARQVLDKMSHRTNLANQATYSILINRLSAADKVEEAISVFHRRKEFGAEIDPAEAFRTLLTWLCRYKHVEEAETLFRSSPIELESDIKSWNIILNGWCVRGNVHEAKRLWRDITKSKFCRPDIFTYGTFVNALTKKGKLGSATKLLRAMWEEENEFDPDVTIYNNMINALCFKKRIPEAFELIGVMKERGCEPNIVTYNTLIKYLCKNRRMDKVHEILTQMEEEEEKRGTISPNGVTFGFLLKASKTPEEVSGLLERMKRNGIEMSGDIYNLVLKLYVEWGCEERVREVWNEIERSGSGPDERSYTIMIHGLFGKGRTRDAVRYFEEMRAKGMEPEPRTRVLVNNNSPKKV